jgi:ribosomal-protein-alanine N-acetyltransferase
MRADGDTRASDAPAGARVVTRLRNVRPSDIEAIVAIESASFGDPWNRNAFIDLLDDPRACFLLADRGGVVRGYVVAWFVLDEGEVGNLAVSQVARRQGVGAQLLDGAIKAARSSSIASLYLEVRDSNIPARNLYASRGFVEIGRRRDYYRRPREDALVLRLDVPGVRG